MKYWWYAHKKGGEVLQLTHDEAQTAMEDKQAGHPITIPRLKVMLDAWEITEFEQSTRRMDQPDSLNLDSGLVADRPKDSATGGIFVQWVKKFVTNRDYNSKDNFYKGPGYRPLRRAEDESGLYVAFTRPVFASGLTDGLEELEDWEKGIIEKRLADTPGWWNS